MENLYTSSPQIIMFDFGGMGLYCSIFSILPKISHHHGALSKYGGYWEKRISPRSVLNPLYSKIQRKKDTEICTLGDPWSMKLSRVTFKGRNLHFFKQEQNANSGDRHSELSHFITAA